MFIKSFQIETNFVRIGKILYVSNAPEPDTHCQLPLLTRTS